MATTLGTRKGKLLAGVGALAALGVLAWQMELVDESTVAMLMGEELPAPSPDGMSPDAGAPASPGGPGAAGAKGPANAKKGSPGAGAPGSKKLGQAAGAALASKAGPSGGEQDASAEEGSASEEGSAPISTEGDGGPAAGAKGAGTELPPLESEATGMPVAKALAAIAAWRTDAQPPIDKIVRAYISHRKAWVALSAYAFAVERKALPEGELKSLGAQLKGRLAAPLVRRFLKRYKDKPELRAALLANLGL